jgi:hypothetical protein
MLTKYILKLHKHLTKDPLSWVALKNLKNKIWTISHQISQSKQKNIYFWNVNILFVKKNVAIYNLN